MQNKITLQLHPATDFPMGSITLVRVENGFDGEFQTVEEYDKEIDYWDHTNQYRDEAVNNGTLTRLKVQRDELIEYLKLNNNNI